MVKIFMKNKLIQISLCLLTLSCRAADDNQAFLNHLNEIYARRPAEMAQFPLDSLTNGIYEQRTQMILYRINLERVLRNLAQRAAELANLPRIVQERIAEINARHPQMQLELESDQWCTV